MKKMALALQFDEVSIAAALKDAAEKLLAVDVPTAHLDARLLLAHALGVTREYLTMHADEFLSPAELMTFEMLVERRMEREPMSHILGQREFWSLNFRVTPDTLDPRPDSETVVEAVLAYVPRRDARLMIADFGTGTGCILLSLLSEFTNAHGLGVDISEAALAVAEENARELGLSARAHFHCSNWGEGVIGRYDVIVSNPPYIAETDAAALQPEVAEWEPKTALFAGEGGLAAYEELMPHIKRLLAPCGIAVLEFGKGQSGAVASIAQKAGLQVLEICADYSGTQRCVVLTHA